MLKYFSAIILISGLFTNASHANTEWSEEVLQSYLKNPGKFNCQSTYEKIVSTKEISKTLSASSTALGAFSSYVVLAPLIATPAAPALIVVTILKLGTAAYIKLHRSNEERALFLLEETSKQFQKTMAVLREVNPKVTDEWAMKKIEDGFGVSQEPTENANRFCFEARPMRWKQIRKYLVQTLQEEVQLQPVHTPPQP